MSTPRLRHNRDFRILCTAQGFSRLGTQVSGIAFPLLVLRITRSPADAGLVGFAEGVALALVLLPGGALADRWNRRAVMLATDIGCAVAMVALCVAVLLKHAPLSVIISAAVVVAGFGASFGAAAGAALRLIVSDAEMPYAVSVIQARNAALTLAGPALGGLLFEISPSLPFLLDGACYVISLLGTLALRTPLVAPARSAKPAPLHKDMLQGVAFIYQHRFLRFTMMNAAVLNFAFTGVLLSLIITTVKDGSTGLTTGAVVAFLGFGSLIGSAAAPLANKRLSVRQAIVIFTWVSAIPVAAMALTQSITMLAVLVAASAVLIPALNVIVVSAQTMITPDAMQGRVQSAVSFIAMSISPLGAAAAGFLMTRWQPAVAFVSFTGVILILAVANTISRSLLQVPAAPAPAPAAAAESNDLAASVPQAS